MHRRLLLLCCGLAACTGESKTPQSPATDGSTTDSSTPSSCPARDDVYPAGTSEASIQVGGAERTFRIFVPTSYQKDTPTAVVLMFHGGGGSAEQFQTQSAKMDPIAEREGFITVYPNGTGMIRTWNGGSCCGRAAANDIDDVAFTSALIDHLQASLCVDRRRVFASGMSNGGILSHRLACELSQRIAAIAPVAGTMGAADCAPSRPVPVLHTHGTLDGHVPFDGGTGCGPTGTSFTSVAETIDGWRQRNGCGAQSSVFLQQGDGTCTTYSACSAPVVLCAVEGGGHSWPGGAPKVGVVDCPSDGAQSQSFIASEVAWKFFQENPLPE